METGRFKNRPLPGQGAKEWQITVKLWQRKEIKHIFMYWKQEKMPYKPSQRSLIAELYASAIRIGLSSSVAFQQYPTRGYSTDELRRSPDIEGVGVASLWCKQTFALAKPQDHTSQGRDTFSNFWFRQFPEQCTRSREIGMKETWRWVGNGRKIGEMRGRSERAMKMLWFRPKFKQVWYRAWSHSHTGLNF